MQQDPETQVVLSRVGDDVAFGAENLSVPPAEIWGRVRESLDDVGLGALPLDHPTSALSGGQKQRLALAGILTMRPGLLLLDEPTANLDPAGVLEVRDAVGRCLDKTGATLVVVEHRVAIWKDLVDRIVVLQPGSATDPAVLIDGPPDRVLEQARDMLIAAGVWVPGHVPVTRSRTAAGDTAAGQDVSAGVLLAADELAVSRERPGRAGLREGFRRIPPRPVQSGITARIRAGEALTITGPNGSGKSTFALSLAGLLQPVGGTVSASEALSAGAGTDPYRWKAQQLIARIGTVFQEPEHQFVTGRVFDELMFGPRHLGYGEDRVEELLERLRLTDLVDANPYTLSGGEKRRLSVATVLAAHPKVLVLDEPTFGQDACTWAELASFLSELLDAGTAIVSVTHDEEFTAALGGTELTLRAPGRDIAGPRTPDGEGVMRDALSLRGNQALLTRANPLAKFTAVVLITVVLALSIDWVSASVALAFELMLFPLAGLTIGLLWQRGWPLILAAALGGWSTAIVAPDTGAILVDAGIWSISDGSLQLGLGFTLRGLAIALPAVLLMSCTDPTDLADALAQNAKLPHRFVLGTLAAMRLVGLMAEEWQTIGMARRARGVGSRGNPYQRIRATLGQSFGLLVQAIRRASRLAVTMEARGFGGAERTWARPSTFSSLDVWVLAGGLVIAGTAVAAALRAGTWNMVFLAQ